MLPDRQCPGTTTTDTPSAAQAGDSVTALGAFVAEVAVQLPVAVGSLVGGYTVWVIAYDLSGGGFDSSGPFSAQAQGDVETLSFFPFGGGSFAIAAGGHFTSFDTTATEQVAVFDALYNQLFTAGLSSPRLARSQRQCLTRSPLMSTANLFVGGDFVVLRQGKPSFFTAFLDLQTGALLQ